MTPRVADSGLWHLMAVDALPVEDVALLVGAVSDNWATNVLVARLGLAAVARPAPGAHRAARPGARPPRTARRTHAEHGHGPGVDDGAGRAARRHLGLARRRRAGAGLARRRGRPLDGRLGWGLDPLVAGRVVNKTGTDDGVRCEVGLVTGPGAWRRTRAWAGVTPDELSPRMRALGDQVRDLVG